MILVMLYLIMVLKRSGANSQALIPFKVWMQVQFLIPLSKPELFVLLTGRIIFSSISWEQNCFCSVSQEHVLKGQLWCLFAKKI